jgi:hypothetical protein
LANNSVPKDSGANKQTDEEKPTNQVGIFTIRMERPSFEVVNVILKHRVSLRMKTGRNVSSGPRPTLAVAARK